MKSPVNNVCSKEERRTEAGERKMSFLFSFFLFPFLLFSFSPVSFSQQQDLTYQSTMLGIGSTSAYDTYLSPLNYTGTNVGWIQEQIKMKKWGDGRILTQHLINLEIAETKNPAGTANEYVGNLEYAYGCFYRFKPVQRIQLFAGLQAGGLAGFVYNSRNGNNPATGKAHLNLSASGMAAYQFQIKKQPLRLRYQLSIPVAGVMFSPEFGQSYYEIGEGDNDNLIHFASLHNQWAMRNLLSVELPFNCCTLRLAYANRIYETQVNHLDTRIISHSFYIGFSKNFFTVSDRQNKNNYRSVFE
jgi:hypothetical protein